MNVSITMKKAHLSDFERQSREASEALRAAIGDSLQRANKARDFLFPDGEKLSGDVIEISAITAPGADHFTVRFDFTDKLRKFTAALAAGEFDGEVVE